MNKQENFDQFVKNFDNFKSAMEAISDTIFEKMWSEAHPEEL